DNAIVNNASEPIWIHGHGWQPGDYEENFFGGITVKSAIHLVEASPLPAQQSLQVRAPQKLQERAQKKTQEKRP
ncbi:MAG TPA: hypothetical protein VG345_14620, partial [Bryobacteraceae bacterium]|nr:hypothetical protein [Bryobacteraceae bacterium]